MLSPDRVPDSTSLALSGLQHKDTMSDLTGNQKYTIRWTQPNGRTGTGDVFDTAEHAWFAVHVLEGQAPRSPLRYSVEPVADDITPGSP